MVILFGLLLFVAGYCQYLAAQVNSIQSNECKTAWVDAEKKLLFYLISQTEDLASTITPKSYDLLEDLARLKKTL